MICLTGDIHHSSLNTRDFQYCKSSEIDLAFTMVKITQNYGLKITLFFTGLCAKESPELIAQIAGMHNVEIGGHNYFAFKPIKLFKYYHKLFGLRNGPFWYQDWEVRRTVHALGLVSGKPVVSWRDHAYRNDRNTRKILKKNGIIFFSDVLSNDYAQPSWNKGLIDVPLNTLPDHDYVYHGSRQPGTFDEARLLRKAFKTKAMTKEQWLERVKEDVQCIEARNGLATILAHPSCMEVFDNFYTFEKLCSFLTNYRSCKMRDIPCEW